MFWDKPSEFGISFLLWTEVGGCSVSQGYFINFCQFVTHSSGAKSLVHSHGIVQEFCDNDVIGSGILKNELSHPLSCCDIVWMLAVVDEYCLDLSSVVWVDYSGSDIDVVPYQ